ncbi:MAG: hypothetical protein V4629_03330 [Pseudomonadota bacterium]
MEKLTNERINFILNHLYCPPGDEVFVIREILESMKSKNYRMKTVEELIAEGFTLTSDGLFFQKKDIKVYLSVIVINQIEKFTFPDGSLSEGLYLEVTE